MDKQLEKILVEKHPKFFREYGGDSRYTCMHWGCTHGNGWYHLLFKLCEELQVIADADPSIDFYFKQIKEKFGTLTIYTRGATPEMEKLIRQCEEYSTNVCEVCGVDEGVVVAGRPYYVQALCESCVEHGNRRSAVQKTITEVSLPTNR